MNSEFECLSKALPSPGRAFSLRQKFNLSVINSVKYLLEICEEVVPCEVFSKASHNVSSLDSNLKVSGLFHIINSDLYTSIENEEIKHINQIVMRLAEDKFQVSSLNYLNITNLNKYYVDIIERMSSETILEKARFFELPQKEFEAITRAVENGFNVIKRVANNFYQEAQELIGEILFLNSEGVKAGCSFDMWGMIHKSIQHKWGTLSDIIDFIIHEQTHLYIYLLVDDDPLVLNAMDFHESPLRKEERPLIGSFHATIVLARVYHVLIKAVEANAIPSEEMDYCQELMAYYKKRYYVGIETLGANANMTNLGSALIESSHKLVA